MIDIADISNILNTFWLIIVVKSVKWIQPAKSYKNYDFFVRPTPCPSFISNAALSQSYF